VSVDLSDYWNSSDDSLRDLPREDMLAAYVVSLAAMFGTQYVLWQVLPFSDWLTFVIAAIWGIAVLQATARVAYDALADDAME
jgi:hypothetical protein